MHCKSFIGWLDILNGDVRWKKWRESRVGHSELDVTLYSAIWNQLGWVLSSRFFFEGISQFSGYLNYTIVP